jgi:arylsulfatase A-like enzyme
VTRLLRWTIVPVLLVASAWVWAPNRDRVPDRLVIDEVVADIGPMLAPAPRRADVRPNSEIDEGGGTRHALVTPPGTVLRARVQLPADAVLTFGVGIEGERRRDTSASDVRFALALDGRELWTRIVNPAATRRDRRWFDERVPLGNATPREAELTLTTTAEQADAPSPGTAAWSAVRLLHTTQHDRQAVGPTRPNVLVLLVDTLRADRLGAYGATPSPTPSLDRLAGEGRVFTQSIAQAPWTLPSVTSILTGVHPRSHGVLGRLAGEHDDAIEAAFLADTFRTLPEHAAAAGITTVGVSANPLIGRGTNVVQGFETFVEYGWDRPRRNWMPATDVNDRFLDWARANSDHRFFAYLQYMEPHDPYTPADDAPAAPAGVRPVVARGEIHDLARKINWGAAPPLPEVELAHLRHLYDGEVARFDQALAQLRAGLEAAGLWDSTIVIVTADHGESFQEHGRLTHGTHLYDELLHVPLVMAGPGIPPGRDDRLAQGIDVYPTVSRLLGLPPPTGVAGHDLLGDERTESVFSETSIGVGPDGARTELVSLRTPAWKLVHAPDHSYFELYDLRQDPSEHTDLGGQTPEGVALAGTLTTWRTTAPAPPAVADAPVLTDKLRALGYVE